MIDDLLMEAIDRVGWFWRPTQKHCPFGGLRMVFVGDFQQLLPVGSRNATKSHLLVREREVHDGYSSPRVGRQCPTP